MGPPFENGGGEAGPTGATGPTGASMGPPFENGGGQINLATDEVSTLVGLLQWGRRSKTAEGCGDGPSHEWPDGWLQWGRRSKTAEGVQ